MTRETAMDRRLALALTLLLVAPIPAAAGIDQAGTTAANFLSVGTGAGPLGMAGAGLALQRDLSYAAWNTAALGGLGETQFVLSHATLAGETQQDWIAVGGRWGRTDTRWALSGLYQGEGSFEGRDVLGVPTGDFSASSLALGAMLARPLGERLRLGLGAKYVREDLAGLSGSGFTFDAGLQFDAGWLSVGAAAQNIAGQMKYESATYRFPTNYGIGVAITPPGGGLRLAVDFDAPAAYYQDVRVGAEWRHRDALALRAGYRHELGAGEDEPLSGPSFGLGAGLAGFWFDYGYVVDGQSGGSQHRLGVTLAPGRFGRGSTLLGSEQGATLDAAPPREDGSSPVAAVSPVAEEKPAPPATPEPAPIEPTPAAQQATVPAGDATPAAAVPTPEAAPAPAKKTKAPKPSKQTAAPAPVVEPPVAATGTALAEPSPVEPSPVVSSGPEAAVEERAVPAPVKAEKPEKAKKSKPSKSKTEGLAGGAAPLAAAAAIEPAAPAPSAAPTVRPTQVKVRSGETLAEIAARYGTTTAAIMMENNLVSEKVKVGQTLKLPKPAR
jgi:LysM repeat protein